ncbi:Cytochrome P450 4C1 [Orchesella cincta]|uniref:long-chain-alcohol O-fatty-acyltransferase n=1 Tax=Orchesella cincta TaxID=48709 RepID=A0A1D2MNB9_ORCCI|nr:Cytochrome P450 4C1 [Orchesella cincta]
MTVSLPGPRPFPWKFIGNTLSVVSNIDIPQLLLKLAKTYGPYYRFTFANEEFIIISSPSAAQAVLSSTDSLHLRKGRVLEKIWPVETQALMIMPGGEEWKKRRKMLARPFMNKALQLHNPCFNKQCERLLDNLMKRFHNETTINVVNDLLRECTFGISSETLMGVDIVEEIEDGAQFHENLEAYNKMLFSRIWRPWLLIPWVWRNSSQFKNLKVLETRMKKVTSKVIEKYREKVALEYNFDENDNNDLQYTVAEVMIRNKVEEQNIFDEVTAMLSVANDTTPLTTEYTLFMLALHPEHQNKCRQEIDAVYNNPSNYDNGILRFEALKEMKHLERCIQESLRIHPITLIMRRLEAPLQIDDKLILPPDTSVIVAPYIMHNMAEYYPNPEIFDPDRFLPEEVKKRNPYSYIPFSGGIRNCIGMKLAQIELKVMIATILRNFEVHTHDKKENIKLVVDGSIRPAEPIRFSYPLAIFIFVPVLSYRSIVERFLPKLDPRFGSALKGVAAVFSARDPYTNPLSVLLPYFYLDQTLDKNHLIKLFNERIVNLRNRNGDPVYIQLRQKIVRKFGYNFWFNVTNFDLSEHIKYLNESDPEGLIKDSEMIDLTLQLSKRPFNSERSPWEILIIPRFQHENDSEIKSALIFRFHHCLADGFSILQIVLRLGEQPMHLSAKESTEKRTLTFMDKFISVIYNLRIFIEGPLEILKQTIFSIDSNQWLTNVEKYYTGKFSAQEYDISLSTLKKIKERNFCVATSLITMLVQATGRTMKRQNVVGNKTKLYVAFPLPLPNRPDGMSNHFTFARMPVIVDVNDVMETAGSVKLEYQRLKGSATSFVFPFIFNLLASLPIEWTPDLNNGFQSTCLFSNFPGPSQPIDIAGVRILEMIVSGTPTKLCAIASLALSYNGKVRFMFGGDKINISKEDADFLKQEIVNVFNKLSQNS